MTKHLKQVLVKSIKFYQCHIIKISFHTTMNVSFSLKPYWSAVILLLFSCALRKSAKIIKKNLHMFVKKSLEARPWQCQHKYDLSLRVEESDAYSMWIIINKVLTTAQLKWTTGSASLSRIRQNYAREFLLIACLLKTCQNMIMAIVCWKIPHNVQRIKLLCFLWVKQVVT